MKFTLAALVGATAASTETGIKMLQKLNSMDQSIENMQEVKVALVQCAAAGDCSNEAAAMPSLALATVAPLPDVDDAVSVKTNAEADKTKHSAAYIAWETCHKAKLANGYGECTNK
jgi:hypothetical protein